MRAAPLVVVLLAGCGDDMAAVEPIDAGRDALCSLPPGNAWVYHSVHVLPSTEGFDLDDDGAIDNEIGKIPAGAVSSANAGLDAAITTGELLMVMYVTNWSEPPTANDPDASFHAFQVYDEDMPQNPDNNFDGAGRFLLPLNELDLSCRPKTEADETTLVDGVMTARNDVWRFTLTTGLGALEFQEAILVTEFSADFTTATSRMGSILSLCTLSALAFPGDTPGTVLDAIVNDPTIRDSVHIDVDVDGDGVEQVIGDGVSIMGCIDGDGTMIMGRDCPCHPNIVDAFSSAMEFLAVSAEVVGII
jgi:hypothetical protein